MALHSAVGATVLILSVSACSSNDSDKKEPSLTASQVCDSSLDSSAAAALRRMGSSEKFTELPGTMDSGEPNKFSLKRAANTVHEDMTQRNQCAVYKAGDTTGHPLIDVDFSAVKDHPSTDGASQEAESENVIYPIGAYAKTHENTSAAIYFKCSTQDAGKIKEPTPFIQGSLYSTPDQISPKTTGRDLMTVLSAITRAMAKQLGCTSEAALPSQVPDVEIRR
ncbi:hypothetical protein J7E95_41860 [Streptomyces sp. ISL-14]|nr:hypothetical protein [Streptomyces sp. ISL-14]